MLAMIHVMVSQPTVLPAVQTRWCTITKPCDAPVWRTTLQLLPHTSDRCCQGFDKHVPITLLMVGPRGIHTNTRAVYLYVCVCVCVITARRQQAYAVLSALRIYFTWWALQMLNTSPSTILSPVPCHLFSMWVNVLKCVEWNDSPRLT